MKMLYRLFTWVCALLLMGACTSDHMITDIIDDGDSEGSFPGVATTFKRGCGFSVSTSTGQWWSNIVNLKANWYYTWGLTGCQDPYAPQNVEFVPMFWSASSVTQANIDMINQLYRDGKIFYVLGFNEPDLKQEANMSVADALASWKVLSEGLDRGIKLVSPATSWPGAQWMKDFMNGVQTQGLRCDYIALHIYMGQSPTTYSNQVKNIANTYGKKIWITEFAPRDDSAESGKPETNHFSEEWIRNNFIEPVLTDYEAMPEVFRYAWFSGSPTMAGLWTSMLVNGSGDLTSLGDYYATIHPNEDILPPKGTAMP